MISDDELSHRLRDEFGYPDYMVDRTIAKIKSMDEPIKSAFLEWYKTGKLPDLAVRGYSIQRLVNDYDMKVVGAFLTMDWLNKDPKEAETALKWGYDRAR